MTPFTPGATVRGMHGDLGDAAQHAIAFGARIAVIEFNGNYTLHAYPVVTHDR
jgi:hypothetical protein